MIAAESLALDHARTYAGHGLAVFPLAARDKVPATAHGVKDATKDGGRIERWFGVAQRDANIAIATGAISGVVVLDVDGELGLASLTALLAEHGATLPRTPRVATGKGAHIYFQHPGAAVKNGVALRPGLDIRADGGYVVAPPSLHPSGDVYEWDVPLDVPFAPVPAFLSALFAERDERPAAAPVVGVVPQGQRRDTAFKDACSMRRRGMDEETILAALRAGNATRWLIQTDDELVDIAHRAAKYEPDTQAIADETWKERQRARASEREQEVEELKSSAYTDLDTVSPRHIEWLWPGYIPLGAITVLDGDPGLGKSTVAFDIAARVSRGELMPRMARMNTDPAAPAGVLIVSLEDDLAATIQPRLVAAGADLARITAIEEVPLPDGTSRLPTIDDLDVIEEGIRRRDCRLVILDPIMAVLSAKTDGNKDQDVRRALAPLAKLAQRTGVAVIIIRHLSKMTGRAAIYRGGGSIGIIGAARAGFIVAKDPDDPAARILAQTKSNLGKPASSLKYRIEGPDMGAGHIVWGEATDVSAEELANPDLDQLKNAPAQRAAADFIREFLAEGPRKAVDLIAEAQARGINTKALQRARNALGVSSQSTGYQGSRLVSLPNMDTNMDT